MAFLRQKSAVYGMAILDAIRSDWLIYAGLVVYLIAGALYVTAKSGIVMGALDVYMHTGSLTYLVTMPWALLIAGISRITLLLDKRRRLAYRMMFGPRRVARFVAGTLLMMLVLLPFEAMFASIKSTLFDNGFPFDKLAADIDKAIHFGHGPAKYLLSFAKQTWVLQVVEFNYNVAWFIVCFGILYWVAISPRADRIRLRYCISFFAVWIIVGNFAAALFPTAGPAFYGLVTDDPQRFDGLRQFLETTSGTFSSAADEQHYLWELYHRGISGFGSGISAFPSVHVALISINAMFITRFSRKLGAAAWAYVALILASSTYLGWHYAIDGYAAILLATAIYWSVFRLMPLIERARGWMGASSASEPIRDVAGHQAG